MSNKCTVYQSMATRLSNMYCKRITQVKVSTITLYCIFFLTSAENNSGYLQLTNKQK